MMLRNNIRIIHRPFIRYLHNSSNNITKINKIDLSEKHKKYKEQISELGHVDLINTIQLKWNNRNNLSKDDAEKLSIDLSEFKSRNGNLGYFLYGAGASRGDGVIITTN